MIRKVMGGADLKRAAGTVTERLSKWLAEKGYVSDGEAREGMEKGAEAGRDLPKAERAARSSLKPPMISPLIRTP